MSTDVFVWMFVGAWVLTIAVIILVIKRVKHRSIIARNQLLDEYRGVFVYSGVKEVNATALAELQMYIREQSLESRSSIDQEEMIRFIMNVNRVCESIRLNPDEAALKNLEAIALPVMAHKQKIGHEELAGVDKHFSFWYYVVQGLDSAYVGSFLMDPYAEWLIFFALLSGLHPFSPSVPSYEEIVSRVARRCAESCIERWSKWLMEDVTFKDRLEKDLEGFREAGEISDDFRQYYRKEHIFPVGARLKDLADELVLIHMQKMLFTDGDAHVPNETYLKVAEAYKEFKVMLI
ncbi:MAG: hypothetical protein ACM3PZ_03490 [Bacillota bacterium]